MKKYGISHWVNFNEYIMTHQIKADKIQILDNKTVLINGKIEIVFEEDIQKIVDKENDVTIYKNDDRE